MNIIVNISKIANYSGFNRQDSVEYKIETQGKGVSESLGTDTYESKFTQMLKSMNWVKQLIQARYQMLNFGISLTPAN